MRIKSLELKNFRNYDRESFVFNSGTNVLYGDNAQGKTNVLEALYLGCTTKSHKGSKDQDIIMRGMTDAHLRYVADRDGHETTVEFHLKKQGKKGIAIDRIPIKKSEELLGICHVVFFSPEDLGIIRDGPDSRRRFLNMELSQLNKIYLQYLTQYKKNLKQRNALLRQIQDNPSLKDTIEIWNKGLVDNGIPLIRMREKFIHEINEIMEKKHEHLTGGREKVMMKYAPDVSADSFEEKLIINQDRDIIQKTTTTGPHRDDIIFLNGDEDIRKYGSQGQKRTTALSLKLAEIDIVESKIGDKPVLLLDDVLSELDRKRQNFLLEQIQGIQTIITCTGLEELVENGVGIDKSFLIENGRCKEQIPSDT
ncbi:MAG: DNA replication/repair protein RecF [Eubacterium sp.]|nr:DNA replication/repair protein RecF [Eubacterium sp.]